MTHTPEGRGAVYLLDKTPGTASRSAASAVARAWGFAKFGHAGTLDPSAGGVLPVLLGRATRLSSYLSGHEKRYSFTVVTGIETDTLDSEGTVTREAAPVTPGRADLEALLAEFEGSLDQRVPVFSALKLGGRTAYSMARSGIIPDMPTRRVEVRSWEIISISDGRFRLAATVSSGTYIRALAADIGTRLGCGAHAEGIVRESYGLFVRTECSTASRCDSSLLTPAEALRGFQRMSLSSADAERVLHGNPVEGSLLGSIALMDGDGGDLIAIGTGDGTSVRPVTVLRDCTPSVEST